MGELTLRLDAESEREYEQRRVGEERRAEEERNAYVEEMRTADPARPMQVRWSLTDGFSPVDPVDPREISVEVQEAVLAWVRERDTWVADRGMVVGEAVLTVWPLALPPGEDRVQRGVRRLRDDAQHLHHAGALAQPQGRVDLALEGRDEELGGLKVA